MTTHDANSRNVLRGSMGTHHRRIGVDILTWQFAIEVESWPDVPKAAEQLRVSYLYAQTLLCWRR